jgi:hypothetical protein
MEKMMIVYNPFVKCNHCGKTYDCDSYSFYTVQGNIYVGLDGGLVGDNILEDKVKSSHYCIDCLFEVLRIDCDENSSI